MIVYCDDRDCSHNEDGICNNHFSYGAEGISLSVNLFGQAFCSDQDDPEEEEDG